MTTIRIALLMVGLIGFCSEPFRPISDKPNVDLISDFIQEHFDYGSIPTNITKDKFISELTDKGVEYYNKGPDRIYDNREFPYDSSFGHYKGSFATRDGRVYMWKMVRRRVIEISDSSHRCCWFIIKNDLTKTAQQVDSAEASTIAVPPSQPSGSPR